MADGGYNSVTSLTESENRCLQKLKVALATAIIRNKPSEVTAKEFAERLAKQLRQREKSWKDRALKLKEELLVTKQELVQARLGLADGRWSNPETEILLADFKEDSNISSSLDNDNEVLTPPNSSESIVHSSKPLNPRQLVLSKSAKFLNSIAKLNSVSSDTGLTQSFVLETVRLSVHSVTEYLLYWLETEHFPRLLAERGSLAVVNVLDAPVLHADSLAEIVEECLKLINGILHAVAACRSLNKVQFIDSASTILETLGRSKYLMTPALFSLLKHINLVAMEMRLNIQRDSRPNTSLCEHSFFFLRTMEVLLLVNVESSRSKGLLTQTVVKELQEGLENSLLHISTPFAMFAQYVWKIVSILELLNDDNDDADNNTDVLNS